MSTYNYVGHGYNYNNIDNIAEFYAEITSTQRILKYIKFIGWILWILILVVNNL